MKPDKQHFRRLLKPLGAFFFALCILQWPFSEAATAEENSRTVVFFNSYHEGYKWSDDEQRGIADFFASENTDISVKLFVEYMDTKRVANPAYLEKLAEVYLEKYRGTAVDLILSADDNAFNFLIANRDRIFPGAPWVFCGVNYFDPKRIEGLKNIAGVNEAAGIKETLALIFDLHPDTKKILVINDQTVTGTRVREQIDKQTGAYEQRATFEFSNGLTFGRILEKARELGSGSVILYTFYFRDSTNRFFEYNESISRLAAASRVPVYGTWDFNLGLGITGGMLTSGYFQGRKAAELAARVLAGEPTDRIGVVMESPNRYFFDYKYLQLHGISESRLPESSIVVNKPDTLYQFYEKNKVVVLISLSVFLTVLVFVLMYSGLKIWRANLQTTVSEQRYRSIFEHTGTATMLIANDTTILTINSQFEKLSGYSRREVESKKSWTHFMHEDDRDRMLQYHKARRTGEKEVPRDYESRFMAKDGSVRNVFVTVGMIEGTDQSVASLLDITDRIAMEKEKEDLIAELRKALEKVKTLKGLVPICSHCKKIRNDQGYWEKIEEFFSEHSEAEFSHSICPDCAKEHFPDLEIYPEETEHSDE